MRHKITVTVSWEAPDKIFGKDIPAEDKLDMDKEGIGHDIKDAINKLFDHLPAEAKVVKNMKIESANATCSI